MNVVRRPGLFAITQSSTCWERTARDVGRREADVEKRAQEPAFQYSQCAAPTGAAVNCSNAVRRGRVASKIISFTIWLAPLVISMPAVLADTLMTVGPGSKYPTISKAVEHANQDPNLDNYYIVEVVPGIYADDFPHV